MTPEDMRRDAERRSRARKKKARPQRVPQTADDTASECSDFEIRNLFETEEDDVASAQMVGENDDIESFVTADAAMAPNWHVSPERPDFWHDPLSCRASQPPVTNAVSALVVDGMAASKRGTSSPVEMGQTKIPRHEETVSRIRSSPEQVQSDRRRMVGTLQPLAFPTSPL